MTSYEDFLKTFGKNVYKYVNDPIGLYFATLEDIYENSHGGNRATIESLPIGGTYLKWKQHIQRAEDHYKNTGTDAAYGYNTPVNPFLRDVGSFVSPVKMARSLSRMYGAEVELNIAKERRQTWESSRKAAQSWQQYERMKRDRLDNYGQ